MLKKYNKIRKNKDNIKEKIIKKINSTNKKSIRKKNINNNNININNFKDFRKDSIRKIEFKIFFWKK